MSDWLEGVKGIVVQHEDCDQSEPEFRDGWYQIPARYRMQIETGIEMSRAMVLCALKGLDTWTACNKPGSGGSSSDLDLAADVDNGLHKYFHLVRQDLSRKIDGSAVRGIQRVFVQIREGLEDVQNCTIQLWSFVDQRIWAAVKDDRKERPGSTASPIRATFGFSDEYGHVPWKGMQGPILLSTTWLKRPPESIEILKNEEIARTLVHEASHRFAGTRDILYKAESFGTDLKAEDEYLAEQGATESDKSYIRDRSAPARITDRALPPSTPGSEKMRAVGIKKDLVSIAPKMGKPSVAPELWLENADSYAWFARRVWKRLGRPGT
jgi:hypothetical protein